VTRRLAFEPVARETYLALRKDPGSPLCLAIKDLLSELLERPGSRRLRQLRYRPDTWGVPVRCGDVRWLVLWRPSGTDPDVVEIHYIGPMPGE
jgi:phosphomannomutase